MIYEKLDKLTGGIEKFASSNNYLKLQSSGFMDLIIECNTPNYISMSHYYKQNGDLCPDPDMEIKIIPEIKMAEAMTYEDSFGYKQVYIENGKKYYPALKKDLNYFLNKWLSNLKEQKFYK
jgi:hypothetical protein